MQNPCKGHSAMKMQKGKYMVGKHDAADHHTQHGQKQKQVKRQQKDAGGRKPAAKQILMPLPVQDVMQDKQKKHSGPAHSCAASPQNWYPIRKNSPSVIRISMAILQITFGFT